MATTAPSRWNFDAYIGSAFAPEMWYYDEAEAPVDLTDWGVAVIFSDGNGKHLLSLTKALSTVTVGDDGAIAFTLSVAQVKTLYVLSTSVHYAINLTPPTGTPFRLLEGRLLINP